MWWFDSLLMSIEILETFWIWWWVKIMVNHLHIKSLSSPVCYQVLLYTYWPGTADMARDEPDSLSDVFNFGKFKRGLTYGFENWYLLLLHANCFHLLQNFNIYKDDDIMNPVKGLGERSRCDDFRYSMNKTRQSQRSEELLKTCP